VSMKAKNMNCDDMRLRLVSLADGAIGSDEAEAARRHLAACEDCRGLLERLQADAELLRREPAPEVPAFLATRIMADVRGRKRPAGRWFGLSPALVRVAAAVLVGVGIWLGILLGRGIVGNQPSLDQKLAARGMEVLNWEGM
jgi:anti-sigma factor RsiW